MPKYLPTKRGRMGDDELVALLDRLEEDSRGYVQGALASARSMAMREYHQLPYADEEDDGLSKFVTSDVQDTIEWVLPSLLKMFTAGENAVEFEPRKPQDEEGAGQATEACNYVFYQQNDGMLVLYSAFKDALQLRGGPVHWYREDRDVIDRERFSAVSEIEIAWLMQQLAGKGEVEITHAEPVSAGVGDIAEPERFDIRVEVRRRQTRIRVESFRPEHLLVSRDWESPMLEDCPYVCRLQHVSLSELRDQGYDVDLSDLPNERLDSDDTHQRDAISGEDSDTDVDRGDAAMQSGWLRREWVLVDYDGDGIAERRRIVRIGRTILENEEDDHVPIANAVPILRQHRWDGMSLADVMADIQRLKTEITRGMLNSMYMSVLGRTVVLADSLGNPQANVDDLLNPVPGAILREKVPNAIRPYESMFIGQQVLPLIQYVDGMKENRSGVGQYFTGNTENALNRTASGTQQLVTQAQQRVELIARMLAETLVRPMFRGVFRLLTMHQIEPLAFRLRGRYVEYDPQEWRDSYDMVINVGLGTGNKDQTLMHLRNIQQVQLLLKQSGVAGTGGPAVTPRNEYEVAKLMAVNSGFKRHDQFFSDPGDLPPPAPPVPPPELVKADMQIKADAVEQDKDIAFELEKQRRDQLFRAQTQIHGDEIEKARGDHEHARGEQSTIAAEERGFAREQASQPAGIEQLVQAVLQMAQAIAKPKRMRIIRDANGRAIGSEEESGENAAQPAEAAGQGG